MLPITRASISGAGANSPPPPDRDAAVPGPSNSGPDDFDANRAAVARAQAAGQRGRRRREPVNPQEAARRARAVVEAENASALRTLQQVCQDNSIAFKDTMYRLLASCPQADREAFLAHVILFFRHVRGGSTQLMTSMLGSSVAPGNLQRFLDMSQQDVMAVAQCSHIQTIAAIYNNRGFPAAADVSAFLTCESLCPGGQLDTELLSAIVAMYYGKGLPSVAEINRILGMSVLKTGDELNKRLLKTISQFYASKGFPTENMVERFLAIDALKKDGEVEQERVATLATMCRGKGFPSSAAVTALFSSELLQRDGQLCMPLLKSISSMHNKRGMPDQQRMAALLRLSDLQLQGSCNFLLLSCIGSMCNNRGMPAAADVQKLFDVPALRTADGQAVDGDRLQCISSMTHGKGLARAETVHALLSVPELQQDGRLDMDLLRCLVTLYQGRGLPTVADVRRLMTLPALYIDNRLSLTLLKTVALEWAGRGFPSGEILEQIRLSVTDLPVDLDDASPRAGTSAAAMAESGSAASADTGQISDQQLQEEAIEGAVAALRHLSSLPFDDGSSQQAATGLAMTGEPLASGDLVVPDDSGLHAVMEEIAALNYLSMPLQTSALHQELQVSTDMHFWSSPLSPGPEAQEPEASQSPSTERCDTPPLVGSPKSFLAKRPRKE